MLPFRAVVLFSPQTLGETTLKEKSLFEGMSENNKGK